MIGLLGDGMGDWLAAGPDLTPLAARFAALRDAAKASKDFAAVDAMKQQLLDAGVEVRMSAKGVELIPGPGFNVQAVEALS